MFRIQRRCERGENRRKEGMTKAFCMWSYFSWNWNLRLVFGNSQTSCCQYSGVIFAREYIVVVFGSESSIRVERKIPKHQVQSKFHGGCIITEP